MSILFGGGKKKTPQQILREHQRLLRRSIRELDRERAHLQTQEKKLILEIKKMAKANQMSAARIMAKDLVRTRQQIQKFYRMKSQLQAVSLRIQTVKSTATMASAMGGVTRAMMAMNQSMNLPALQRIMIEFEKQSEMMDMKQEMMEDTFDDIFEDEDEEEETEDILNQVLDEIGINLKGELQSAPLNVGISNGQQVQQGQQPQLVQMGENGAQNGAPNGVGAPPGASPADNELQARLDNLRKNL
eukprot:TRINITY_DN151_c0_g1_i1.p1 TRINITY_DN151_c0_g1~~TRINITY_DN151_c0_g1_i1.p1  ORF type:complete len:245 (+),score=74.31 TRINITY_DN151_c0_g1_i1:72-806(+)